MLSWLLIPWATTLFRDLDLRYIINDRKSTQKAPSDHELGR